MLVEDHRRGLRRVNSSPRALAEMILLHFSLVSTVKQFHRMLHHKSARFVLFLVNRAINSQPAHEPGRHVSVVTVTEHL